MRSLCARASCDLEKLADAPDDGCADLLAPIDGNLAWLEAHAAEAPMNFAHLHRWIAAERLEKLPTEGQRRRAEAAPLPATPSASPDPNSIAPGAPQ